MIKTKWSNAKSCHMNIIDCDNCDSNIDVLSEHDDIPESYKALNIGQHECSSCKRSRHARYDDYVDPLNVYH